MNGQVDMWIEGKTDRLMDRCTDGQMNRQTNGETDRQAAREKDRWWHADLTQLRFFYLKLLIFGNSFFQMQLMIEMLQGLKLEQTDTIITNFPPQWDNLD